MELGCAVPVSGSWATAEGCTAVASWAEELGYGSLWTFQRLLAPVGPDGEHRLEPQYRSVQDPLSVLAYLAAKTSKPRLGVAVVNAPYYSPIVLAKQLTTIDHLSGGRLDVGIGLGWMPEEFEAAGVPYEHRGARTADFVRCLGAIWAQEVVEYEGPYFRVPRARVDPKPLQRPRPPVLFGGTAAPSLRRAGRMADGWVSSSRADLGALAGSIGVVRAAAEDAGRDPSSLRFVCRAVVKVRSAERAPLTGTLDEIREDLGALAASGMTEAFIDLNFDPLVGSPDADAAASLRHARTVLEALAPVAGTIGGG
ncbi:MAG: TIGR03619 family F420-dependent LLM class oxidoreductase [Actinomycetota bacterium]|jgi:probable F420-dependent oxidoreductase|nr:TIGR03619 family F420-dependent LLM class oxidoreductase [Actinomycetota bacterium]